MGKLRCFSQATAAVTLLAFSGGQTLALAATTDPTSTTSGSTIAPASFSPFSSSPANTVFALPGVNTPCLSTGMGIAGQDALTQGVSNIMNVRKGGKAQPPGAANSCSLGHEVPKIDQYQNCSVFTVSKKSSSFGGASFTKGGIDSSGSSDPVLQNLFQLQSGLAGCDGTIQQIQAELSNCLQPAEQNLNAQMDQFATAYNNAVSQISQVVGTQKLKEADVDTQIKAIQQQLGGNSDMGQQGGLVGMQQRLNSLANGSAYDQVRALEAQGQNIQQTQSALASQISQETMAAVNDCFNRPDSNLHCQNFGNPVTPVQYLQCMYSLGAQGGETSSIIGNEVNGSTSNLNSDVQQLLGAMPTGNQGFDMTQFGAAAQTQHASFYYGNLNLQTIQAQYLPRFAKYGSAISGWVSSEFSYCYGIGMQSVAAREGDANDPIGKAEYQVGQMMKDNQTQFNKVTSQYTNEWATDLGGLWHAYNSNNIMAAAGCQNSNLQTQSSCLENLHSSLQSLLTGAGQPGVPVVSGGCTPGGAGICIPSKFAGGENGDAGTTIPNFSCQGVNDCVQKLQDLGTERASYKQTMVTHRTQWTQQQSALLSQNVLQPSIQTASMLAQAARKEVLGIAQKLAALGITASITPPALTPGQKDPGPNQDGVPQLPDGGAKALLTSTDLTQSFQDINSALGEASKKVSKEKTDIATLIDQVKVQEQICAQTQKGLSAFAGIDAFTGACVANDNPGACDDTSVHNAMQDLLNTIADYRVTADPSLTDAIGNRVTALNGWVSSCRKTQAIYGDLTTDLVHMAAACQCDAVNDLTSCYRNQGNWTQACQDAAKAYHDKQALAKVQGDANAMDASACSAATLNAAKDALKTGSNSNGDPTAGIGQ